MIPYSFGGESVNENAIVALPRSLTEMLFGLSRSGWMKLFSDFGANTTSDFVVVSLTRDAAKWTIITRWNGREFGYLQSINFMCYTEFRNGIPNCDCCSMRKSFLGVRKNGKHGALIIFRMNAHDEAYQCDSTQFTKENARWKIGWIYEIHLIAALKRLFPSFSTQARFQQYKFSRYNHFS